MFISGNQIEEELLTLQANTGFTQAVAGIKTGRFKRDVNQVTYQYRVTYTQHLRNYMYDPARLNVIFSDASLQHLFFRTFGYQGNTRFTIYPNAWLRDLPLLDIGENVYFGDGILLGTNQISENQQFIKVGRIRIGKNTIFDQHCSVGLDTQIGQDVQVRFKSSIGLKCTLGNSITVGECSIVGHRAQLGDRVRLGLNTKLGNFVRVDDDVVIGDFQIIPPFSHVTRQGVFSSQPKAHNSLPNALAFNTMS
ncbi:LbetaH domain-containing protein [Microscilla marina]|uniref:Uncharacterized protein n=1 Tax=Microscilla marina ATCC 23134 TaxID=313606 RepID=A1ZWX7_MICM2|nr:hypothetical protein [Microscilla marina]EAY25154.1 hypothetical protein M23134_05925 [Microscilla marina ATCC 23134]